MAVYRKWSTEELKLEASSYTNRHAFNKGSPAAYSASRRKGILDSVCSHMPLLVIPWTCETVTVKAAEYSTRKEFCKSASGAYEFALRAKLLDTLFPIPWSTLKKYSIEELTSEALKYTYRTEFRNNSYKHYQAARDYGVLSTICSHMLYKGKGFKKDLPAILYYFKIDNVWKIGISNRSFAERYKKEDRLRMTNVVVQHYTYGYTAFDIEQEVLKLNKHFKASGSSPFTDGTLLTECFIKDIRILT